MRFILIVTILLGLLEIQGILAKGKHSSKSGKVFIHASITIKYCGSQVKGKHSSSKSGSKGKSSKSKHSSGKSAVNETHGKGTHSASSVKSGSKGKSSKGKHSSHTSASKGSKSKKSSHKSSRQDYGLYIRTPNLYSYHLVGINIRDTTSVVFRVRACNDAHVLLMERKNDENRGVYEIVIGGWGNKKSVIRNKKQQRPPLAAASHRPLDCHKSRPFWVSWAQGTIRVGTGFTVGTGQFMSYRDKNPSDVNYIAVSTGWGTTGIWSFVADPCDSKPCKNGGICRSEAEGYTCRCQFGWSGKSCTERNVCECTASGDPHYKTFDGQMIHFQGVCTYKLAEVWHGTCGIVVHVKNVRSDWNPHVSLTKTMYVFIGNDKITIERQRKITINRAKQTAPFETADYSIVKNGEYIVVQNRCGMKAMFNGAARVKIIINKEDGHSASGICGDCDDARDDYRLKDGTDVSEETKKYSMIGNSYVVGGYNETEAECTEEDEDVACTEAINRKIQTNEFCGYIRDPSGPFKECLGIISETDAETYYSFCAYDVCANWGNAKEQVCNALETFLDFCTDNGAGPINFRTSIFCPYRCQDKMVYNPYISTLQPSCKDRSPLSTIGLPPEEGCVCKTGYVLDNAEETCIDVDNCGCSTSDNYYHTGETFTNEDCTIKYACVNKGRNSVLVEQTLPGCSEHEECKTVNGDNRCVCKEGFVRINGVCMDPDPCDSRPCMNGGTCTSLADGYTCSCRFGWGGKHCTDRNLCECSASGDPHYKTFDGQMIHFQGMCTYKLVEVWHGTCGIIVHVRNIRSNSNPKVSLTKTVYIIIGHETIIIDQNRKITINKVRHIAPYETEDYSIVKYGDYIVVENRCGMRVMFNGAARVKITINREDGHSASGICGDCNDIDDDYRLQDGTDVSGEAMKFSMIGNSYVVEGYNETEADCTKEAEDISCTEEVEQVIATNNFCGNILDTTGPFRECLEIIPATDAEMFFRFCAYDVCANWGNPTQQICSAMETFLDYCYFQGAVAMVYRNNLFCPANCGTNMLYNPYITDPQPSCKAPNPPQVAKLPPAEGCLCDKGFVFDNAKEMCVAEDDCGCSTNDNYYPLGGTFTNEDCTITYTCVNNGGTSALTEEILPGCGGNADCKLEGGVNTCVCKEGTVRVEGVCTDDVCSSLKPCHNGGTCSNKENGLYECCCPPEWSGKHCEKEIEILSPKPPGPHEECIRDSDPKGLTYFGTQDTTTSGRKCQAWSSRYPHKHTYHDVMAGEWNYCRNRLHGGKGRYGPWCYTTDPDKPWEYCDNIPRCSNPTPLPPPPTNPGCYNRSDEGSSYVGPVWYTVSGKRCENWDNFPDNLCRNPYGRRPRPWCWTRDGKEDCDVNTCALPPPVPGENSCAVDTFISVCMSSSVLKGDCYFRHALYQTCDFTIVRKDRSSYDIHMPGVMRELDKQGQKRYTSYDCDVTFQITGDDQLTIKYQLCGWCARMSYESFMKDIVEGTHTCPGLRRIRE